MTDFKSRIKDALSDFVEFDEDGVPKAPAAPAASAAPAAPAAASAPAMRPSSTGSSGSTSSTSSTSSVAGTADPDTVRTLEQAIAGSSKAGYDEFRTLYAAMAGVPDEGLRYSVALKAVEASHHITPIAVLASVDDRIALLRAEQEKFDTAAARETERTVSASAKQADQISTAIAARQAEIHDLEAQQAALRETAASAQADIDRSRADFAAAFATVHSSLAGERARIAAHLPTKA